MGHCQPEGTRQLKGAQFGLTFVAGPMVEQVSASIVTSNPLLAASMLLMSILHLLEFSSQVASTKLRALGPVLLA